MKRLRFWFLLSFAALLIASTAAAAIPGPQRMLAPGLFGFDEVAPNIFAPPGVDRERVEALLPDIEQADREIRAWFETDYAKPIIVLCPQTSCDKIFGKSEPRGTAYGSYIIRLKDLGMNKAIVKHELSHIALKSIVGDFRAYFGAVPAWFDEGLAVHLSGDTRFDRDFPDSAAAYMRKTGSWRTFGESSKAITWQNAYGGSRDLVRDIEAKIGRAGILQILQSLSDGDDFETALTKAQKT